MSRAIRSMGIENCKWVAVLKEKWTMNILNRLVVKCRVRFSSIVRHRGLLKLSAAVALAGAVLIPPQSVKADAYCSGFFQFCDVSTDCYGGYASARDCNAATCSTVEQECNAYCNDWSSGSHAYTWDCVETELSTASLNCLCV